MKLSGERRTTATPRWFGPVDRPQFGWLHRPPGRSARALVVMCPSMGQEALFSHFVLRSLADELAELGFVVVRFDYDGTGDSSGTEHDPDRVAAWLDSIDHAVALGREHTDAPLSLFGFRLGALLAVTAADRCADDVHSLVLWDAPRSGRQFLREQVMRQNVSVGGTGPRSGELTALGLTLTERTRTDLSRLDLRRRRSLPADAVLMLERSGQPGRGAVTDRRGHPVDHVEAVDQDELLSRQALPMETHRAVVRWLGRTHPDAEHRITPFAAPPVQSVDVDGVSEQVTSVGPNGLFGIITEPVGPAASNTTVVFVPDSTSPHSGLSRIWTQLAREWARAGVRSLRFDLTGCADSPVRDGVAGHTVGLLAHLDDTADALRHARPDDPSDTVVVGLCSGAYLSLEAGLAVRPRGLAMINPVLSFITPEPVADPRRRAIVLTRRVLHRWFGRRAGRIASRLARTNQTPAFTTDPHFAWNRAFEACFGQIYLHSVAPWFPERVWRVINGMLTTRSVASIISEVRAGGTEVLLVAGDPDYDRFLLGSRRRLQALARRGGLRMEHHRQLDHAMMRPGAKDDVARSLTRFVLDLAGPGQRVLPFAPHHEAAAGLAPERADHAAR